MDSEFRVIIHGSFSKYFTEIKEIANIFASAGIDVLAPKSGDLVSEKDGFALFEDELKLDPRLVELMYIHNLKKLGNNGFSYFVNPEGYIGKSTSYELGIAQLTNTRCFFSDKLLDHPAYIHKNSIWSPRDLVEYILSNNKLPYPQIKTNERNIDMLWKDLMVPGSVVAAGAIIEHQPKSKNTVKQILLVKTHKWGNRYSIVGGKVKRNEKLNQALLREVREETSLVGRVGRHLCTFDQINNSGYYQKGIQHIFVDNIVKVEGKRVKLNDEAQEYMWATANDALKYLDIEPNARTTIEIYQQSLSI